MAKKRKIRLSRKGMERLWDALASKRGVPPSMDFYRKAAEAVKQRAIEAGLDKPDDSVYHPKYNVKIWGDWFEDKKTA